MTPEQALEKFEEWYEACLENGIEPEAVVQEMGEMLLLVNDEQIKIYEKGCED